MAGLYANLIGPLPGWFPFPGLKDGKPLMNGKPMELGETICLCVFLIPFLAIGAGTAAAAIMSLIGRMEVVIDEFESYVVMVVWIVVWKRRFDPRQVQSVKLVVSAPDSEGVSSRVIELSSDRTIKFGSMLAEDRKNWMQIVLRELLIHAKTHPRRADLPVLNWIQR